MDEIRSYDHTVVDVDKSAHIHTNEAHKVSTADEDTWADEEVAGGERQRQRRRPNHISPPATSQPKSWRRGMATAHPHQ